MELSELKKNNGKGKRVGYMLEVNKKEALLIIKSLAAQLVSGNPNTQREEFSEKNYNYFSIAVQF